MIWLVHGYFRKPDQGEKLRVRLARRVDDPIWDEVWERIDPQRLGKVGEGVRYKVSTAPASRVADRGAPHWGDLAYRLEAEVARPVRHRLWECVGALVQVALADHFGPKVWDHVWPQVRDLFGGHVVIADMIKDYGLEEYFDQIPRKVALRLWHHEWQAPFDTHVAPYTLGLLAHHDACVRGGLDLGPPLDGLMRVARSAGWWWPLERVVFLAERPTALHLDADGRLHHPDGPAVVYPDGFAVHARHGRVVPAR